MNARNVGLMVREIAASFVIAILFPSLVYYGLHTFVASPSNLLATSVYLVAGALAIAAGLLTRVPSLGTGLILGGGFAIIAGYVTRWSHLSNLVIFVSLLAVIGLLSCALWQYSQKK